MAHVQNGSVRADAAPALGEGLWAKVGSRRRTAPPVHGSYMFRRCAPTRGAWSQPHTAGTLTSRNAVNNALKLISISVACVATFGLAACNRNESQTVGQGVDKTIADAKMQGEAAKMATQDAAKTVVAGATDAAITTKVNAALVADESLKVMKVNVDTKAGRVILMGTAPDAASRERATTMAKAIEGVTEVDNQLRVETKP
jgi:hyperosmotically inducible periplasmic protein